MDCRCKNGYIEYWYDNFKELSCKDKLGWLKFEYGYAYRELSKEDKKLFVKEGWTYCPTCKKAY